MTATIHPQPNTLATLQQITRKPFQIAPLYDGSPKASSQMDIAAEIAVKWQRQLEATGARPDERDTIYAANMFFAWQQGTPIDRPVIIAAPPAFGKSTMLSVFLKHMTEIERDKFGAVIVKERVADVEALVTVINGGPVAKRRAFAIKGYNAEHMTREQYEQQFTDQSGYNIVVMTTKQFELQTLKKNLRNFTEFYDSYGRSRPRRLLIIDEKPSLVINHTLTARNLNEFLTDVQEVGRRIRGKVQPYYRKVLPIVAKLRDILEAAEEYPTGKFPTIDPTFRLPIQLERDYASEYGHDRMKLMRAFERVVQHGGIYNVINGLGTVTTTQIIHYQYTLFNTFILDGTASKDPDYNASDFYLTKPTYIRSYSNVTFHVCDKYNLSRTSLEANPGTLAELATMTKRIIAGKTTPTLVVTYMSFVGKLGELLADEIVEGNIIMKHFDGGRGSNAYTAADTAIYFGTLFKGTSYYTATTQAVVGDRLGKEISSDYEIRKTGIQFADQYVQDYRTLDTAVDLTQETNRLRASQKKQDVNIYLFNKDADIIASLLEGYPHAKVKEFAPIEKLSGTKTAADDIIKYFADMPVGSKVKGSAVYKTLGIHRNTFSKELSNQRVTEAMSLYRIEKDKTSFVKGKC